MLRKTIGLVIFLVALFFQIGVENILNFFDRQVFAFLAASTLGLYIANYRHGMDRTFLLKKLKKYVIFSGVMASLIQVMDLAYAYSINIGGMSGLDKSIFLHIISPFFWAYAISILIETMILED